MDHRQIIYSVLAALLAEQGRSDVAVADASPIHDDDGLAFDSLTTAQLSAKLEEAFGTDPYSTGRYPATVGELLAFYV